MWQTFRESRLIGFLSLFTSFGTLLCCALPSTLVLLGFGAGLAGLLSKFPELIWLSDNKLWVFGISFFMLGISYLGQKYAAIAQCPVDKKADCEEAKNWSKPLFYVSVSVNLVGFIYAFVLPKFL